jgi:hypothetical protein
MCLKSQTWTDHARYQSSKNGGGGEANEQPKDNVGLNSNHKKKYK